MNLRKYGIVTISVLILLGSCFTVAATGITDNTGDVWHWANTGTAWSWRGNIGNKPDIDITEISYEVNGDKITLRMKVAGSIQASEKITYWVYYNSTDTTYWLSYSNGTGLGYGMNQVNMDIRYSENVSVSGDTLSVVLDVIGDTSAVALWGWAAEYTDYENQATNEWWGDWAPNDKFGYDTGDDGTDDDDGTDGTDGTDDGSDTDGSGSETNTPGFELLFVVAAVAVALILLRKRR